MFERHEARYQQHYSLASAADALTVTSAAVPVGKVWTIRGFAYWSSISESRLIQLKLRRDSIEYPVAAPTTIITATAWTWTPFSVGDVITLYQYDLLKMIRDAATAGSTMNIGFLYIEEDLPYFSYVDPKRKLIERRGSRLVEQVFGGSASPGTPAGGIGGGKIGGGGGGSEPI